MKSGIYKILNTINGKQYIGSAVNLNKRKTIHWSRLRKGNHPNLYLQNAWNKDGEISFEFRVIGKCCPENLVGLEQEVMDHLKPEYNLRPAANSQLGFRFNIESKRKMREAKIGRPLSTEHKRKLSLASPHKKMSDYNRQKLMEANLGRHPSNDTRRKIGLASKGRTFSLEARRKMRAAKLGRIRSEEHCLNISKSKMGHAVSEETRRKISEGLKNRKRK